jgi:hypothetical protein
MSLHGLVLSLRSQVGARWTDPMRSTRERPKTSDVGSKHYKPRSHVFTSPVDEYTRPTCTFIRLRLLL